MDFEVNKPKNREKLLKNAFFRLSVGLFEVRQGLGRIPRWWMIARSWTAAPTISNRRPGTQTLYRKIYRKGNFLVNYLHLFGVWCLDLSVGCLDLSVGCLDLSSGCFDFSSGWRHPYMKGQHKKQNQLIFLLFS